MCISCMCLPESRGTVSACRGTEGGVRVGGKREDYLKTYAVRDGKVAQWVGKIAVGPDDLNSVPETHRMEEDGLQISACIPTPTHK